ncbi:MAG: hypothetical protein HF973_17425 [Chloroflexi bacterium]|nr:hypothetical protein [Chloroflexota bacterium]
MNRKYLPLIIGAILFLFSCACILASFAVALPDGHALKKGIYAFLLVGLGGGLILLALVGGGLSIRQSLRSPGAGERLAQKMGLPPLNRAQGRALVWYGGERAGYRFAFKPVTGWKRYSTTDGQSRTRVSWRLQVIVALPATGPTSALPDLEKGEFRLYDRAAADGLPPEVWPDAAAILVADLPQATAVTPEKLYATLDEMIAAAQRIAN